MESVFRGSKKLAKLHEQLKSFGLDPREWSIWQLIVGTDDHHQAHIRHIEDPDVELYGYCQEVRNELYWRAISLIE